MKFPMSQVRNHLDLIRKEEDGRIPQILFLPASTVHLEQWISLEQCSWSFIKAEMFVSIKKAFHLWLFLIFRIPRFGVILLPDMSVHFRRPNHLYSGVSRSILQQWIHIGLPHSSIFQRTWILYICLQFHGAQLCGDLRCSSSAIHCNNCYQSTRHYRM